MTPIVEGKFYRNTITYEKVVVSKVKDDVVIIVGDDSLPHPYPAAFFMNHHVDLELTRMLAFASEELLEDIVYFTSGGDIILTGLMDNELVRYNTKTKKFHWSQSVSLTLTRMFVSYIYDRRRLFDESV